MVSVTDLICGSGQRATNHTSRAAQHTLISLREAGIDDASYKLSIRDSVGISLTC